MSGYYAYITDNNGHISSRIVILLPNDEEAITPASSSTVTP